MPGNIGLPEALLGMLCPFVVVGLVWLLARAVRTAGSRSREQPPGESGLGILQKRYARGEISREQYQQMRQDLEAPGTGGETGG